MKKKVIAIVISLIILILTNFLFIWGICFEEDGGFKFSTSREFLESFFPLSEDSKIKIEDGNRTIGIPFIILFYFLEDPPYTIKLVLKDQSQNMRQMAIETVTVKYEGGEVAQEIIGLVKDFTPSIRATSISGKHTTFPIMYLEAKVPTIVKKRENCTVQLKGYFVDVNGNKLPYESDNYFKYEPISWRIYKGLGSF